MSIYETLSLIVATISTVCAIYTAWKSREGKRK